MVNYGGAVLTIWTTTWSRPDLVQLLADALRATAQEPYMFKVVVQPGGLRRAWRNVDEVVDGTSACTTAWLNTLKMAGAGRHLHLHDDCVPLRAWSLPSLPCGRSLGGGAVGSTLIAWEGRWRPFAGKLPAPRARPETMPDWWPEDVRRLAEAGQCEVMLGGDFLHIDKSTIHHPSSPYNAHKPALVEAICRHLGVEPPEPLTADELAFQNGWRPAEARKLPDEDGGAVAETDRPMGLGDMAAAVFGAVGITEERVSRLLGRPCGCSERREAMNALGRRFGIG